MNTLKLKQSKYNQLLEIELVKQYKETSNLKEKDRIFSEVVTRYKYWLLTQTNFLYTKIPSEALGIDFEDCEIEVLHCVKLALDWFDFNKVGQKFDSGLFNLTYYIKKQVQSRVAIYWYKYQTRKKRSVESFQVEDVVMNQISCKRKDHTEVIEQEMLYKELDSRICNKQKELKNYLMKGVEEIKIKAKMKLKDLEYSNLKENLKQNMIRVGLGV